MAVHQNQRKRRALIPSPVHGIHGLLPVVRDFDHNSHRLQRGGRDLLVDAVVLDEQQAQAAQLVPGFPESRSQSPLVAFAAVALLGSKGTCDGIEDGRRTGGFDEECAQVEGTQGGVRLLGIRVRR